MKCIVYILVTIGLFGNGTVRLSQPFAQKRPPCKECKRVLQSIYYKGQVSEPNQPDDSMAWEGPHFGCLLQETGRIDDD